ncbi:hypothetical protein PGTUg99_035621 [Puccinia graminis f. sp. tritici]|uniref:Uncharacterized protein n=1 Tax=Puccinia graminis f. sp. tritici TaxID=56615 RepID=A0A5B0QUY4_PUCGR|nr:hypothetical protein PGTUg99_035621 [Puccinia graminis f. sp. tritici]
MVEGYPSRIPAIRWRIPARANGYPPAGADSGADGPFSANRWRVSGYPKGYPPSKGLATDRLEGNPSSRRYLVKPLDKHSLCLVNDNKVGYMVTPEHFPLVL